MKKTRRDLTQTLLVSCRNGRGDARGVKVRALLHPCGLAVTERITRAGAVRKTDGNTDNWTVTHTLSGLRVERITGSVDYCWRVIGKIATITDWTQSVAALRDSPWVKLEIARRLEGMK